MVASLGTPVSYAAEEETYYVSSSGDDTTGDGTRDLPFATLYTAYQKIGSAGTIYVLDNINLLASTTKKFDKNKVVTITTAPGVGETAVIQRDPAGDGTLLDLNLGQLTLKNIIMDGNYQGGKMAQGRIINVYDAKLIIEEGTVLQNSYSNFPGSAIYLGQITAVLQMTGGVITGNKNNSTGAVYLGAGTFNMTGGQITNNSGGGVDIQAGKFALSGDATITGNTIVVSGQPKARNVNLQGSTLLTLSGEFTGKAGITAQNRMTAGSKFGQADAGDLAGLENLIADDSPLFAVYGESNALLWKAPPTVTFEQPSGDKVPTGKPEFKGTSTAGSKVTVEIKDKDGNVVDTPMVTVDAEGNWTFTPTRDLEDGEYTVEVTATTDEGKLAKATKSITVDTTPTTEPVVDKSKLQAKEEQIKNENLKAEDYTSESWEELQKALQKAEAVLADPNATQQEVEEALSALTKAREELKKPGVPTQGPGGVSEGLLSWVDVERSAVLSGKQINQLTDLADRGAWMPSGASSNDNVPNALNFNSGIQIDSSKGYYTRSSIDFNNNATTDREIFSVQASDRYIGFPWEFGGKHTAAVVYGANNGKSISSYFGRDEGSLSVDVGDYQLKNGAMLNIWSAPNDWALSLNGKVLQETNSNNPNFASPITSGSKPYYFGAGHNSRFYGKMSETILYNRKLTDEDRNKVNSYLALKYGLTLKDENNAPIDYVASNGSTMWKASNNTGYGNRITGIGRDEVGALYQKQSKSQVDGANVTLAIGNAIQETNAQNTTTIAEDKSFFVFSDNGGDVTFVAPLTKDTESLKRIGRTYKVEKTNWQDRDITLQVDKVKGASEWPLYLVVSGDEQFDQNDAFHPLTDGKVTLNSAEFATGHYFTIATIVPVPTAATIEETVADGNKITLTFDRRVELTDLTGFTITVDGTPLENGGLTFKVDENDATKLVITLPAGTNVSNKAVNISYDGLGNLKGTNGAPVDPFNKNVENPGATITITEPSTDRVTVTKPEFKGTSTPGSKVTVEIKDKDGNVVDTPTVTADAEGNWTFTPTQDLKDGEYTVEVTATTVDGKTAKATKSITVDTTPTQPVVDKSKLQAKAGEIKTENLKADDYTTESWEELQKALQKAEAVLADPNATQQEVDEALTALTKARDGLKKQDEPTPTVDKTKLQAKADEIKAENLKEEEYTSASWAELKQALEKANAVLADPNATQQEVDEALSALTKARDGLKKPSVPTPTPSVDKTKLQAKADKIQSEDLVGEDYTSESWEELQKALEKANAVLADRNATQEEVDKALSALTKARDGLKKPDEPTPTVDKSKLQAKVDEIDDEDLDEDDYTSSSWRKLEKALKRAKDVLEDPDATQEEVDEALAELKKARRDLESVDKRDRDRDKERKKDRKNTHQVQNPFFTGGSSGYIEPKPSEPAKEKNDQTGYMNGYPTGNFDPNRQVTRAEMAMILVNTGMVKTTSASGMFMDVADQHWAADAIRRANEAGLMNGYANGTFNPGGGITRAEMATIVYKYLGLNGDGMPNNFYDVPADHWATQIIAAVSKDGYLAGYPDGTFHPQKTLTRAETVTIINRLLNHQQLSPVTGQSWPDVPPTHWAYKDIEAATKK
ncbi:S-layer homology domain-containing protein [Brevibacillus sp. HB1.3]|uniref:S-layer homology domain-containing protein n=1 Tax=Brevibacillus sp. HB1.3 TaxID=2738842 RepID=UPI001C12E6E5|nr:S-layer homology domain-containing protein [Brevibacillus sp. HB1.3]